MRNSALLVSTAIGLTLICNPVFARPPPSIDFAKTAFKSRAAKKLPSPGDGSRPWRTFVTWSAGAVMRVQGLAREDEPFKIDCRKACTVVTDSMAQFQSYYPYDEIALCPVVDGYFTNGSCYFSGELPPSPLFANRTNQTNISLGSGSHIVQTYVYTTTTAYLGHYQNDYHIYE